MSGTAPRLPRRHRILKTFLTVVGVGIALFLILAVWVYRQSVSKFEVRRLSLPTRIYADYTPLKPGVLLEPDDLGEKLERLGYRQSDSLAQSGDFVPGRGEIDIYTRAFTHPSGKYLYAVKEVNTFNGKRAGAVSAFAIEGGGKLRLLNEVSSGGTGPCHVAVDKTGSDVMVANYDGGSIAILPIEPDGRLKEASAFVQHKGKSVNPERQEAPHAHCINTSPDNHFVLVADLGLDEVLIYRFDPARGSVTPNNPPFGKTPPGAGPRHFAFHPNGRFVYVINEIQCTMTTFAWDPTQGSLTALQTLSTVPKDHKVTKDDSTAEVRVHPSGKFVYGSNRGPDSIAVFGVDAKKGTLTPIEHAPTQGKTPRGFNLDPSGNYLITGNQDSDNIVVFKVDSKTGKLTSTGQNFEVGAPVDVLFVPAK